MAFSKKPSLAVVLVVLILFVTQPAYSKRLPGSNCKPMCYMKCLAEFDILSSVWCVGKCLLGMCKSKVKTLSNTSIQCGISCVNSKCANHGALDGKVSERCVTSCVNGCDERFEGNLY